MSHLYFLGYKIPFKWGVHFDDGEIAVTCAAIALNTCEQGMAAAGTGVPNGMIGFNMLYWQVGPLTIATEVHHCRCPFIFAVVYSSLPLSIPPLPLSIHLCRCPSLPPLPLSNHLFRCPFIFAIVYSSYILYI